MFRPGLNPGKRMITNQTAFKSAASRVVIPRGSTGGGFEGFFYDHENTHRKA